MKLQRIAQQAQRYPEMVFNNVFHVIDEDFLREAYHRTRKNSAPGPDKVTAQQYAANLDENLRDLHERLRANRYVAPPVERVWIEKEEGKKRPISKPCFEDKIVQRAVVMVLEAIFEHDFYAFSHGFRRGHSPHQALDELRKRCSELSITWIVDADVSGFFDTIDRGHLRELITRRVSDGRIVRLIGKWLHAGVLEAGELSYPDQGIPQGGVASPLLANVVLHHVLDEWFVNEVQPRMTGRGFLVRFADDFIIGFETEADARRVMAVLPKRFGRFNLTIHREKTALIAFNRPRRRDHSAQGQGTFDFLGFTHYWAKTRRGYWVIKKKTVGKRLRRFMHGIWTWCRDHRHAPLSEQHRMLCAKLRGYYQYHGIRGNYKALAAVAAHTKRGWRYWLSRRSHKGRLTWQKYERSVDQKLPLPQPRIIHQI
jgi:group II intron reverse transcriptase/maturase